MTSFDSDSAKPEKALIQKYSMRALRDAALDPHLMKAIQRWSILPREELTRYAESGLVIAQYALGQDYLKGTIMSRDLFSATQWMVKSAQGGFLPAMSWCQTAFDCERKPKRRNLLKPIVMDLYARGFDLGLRARESELPEGPKRVIPLLFPEKAHQ